jgi:hypothetical protein
VSSKSSTSPERRIHPDTHARCGDWEFSTPTGRFSWRDLQIFSPQDMDGGLRDALIFFHAASPPGRIGAAFSGIRGMFIYATAIRRFFRILKRVSKRHPAIAIALGGTGIRIFRDRVRSQVPQHVRILGETGLDGFLAMLDVVPLPDSIEPNLSHSFVEPSFPS